MKAAILERHRGSLRGRLRHVRLRSRALGIAKPFLVYEPPGLEGAAGVPLLYLFRGHEREWANPREDGSRLRTTAVEDLDRRIVRGELPPVVAVLPGLASSNNHVPALGVDMAGAWDDGLRGLGTGRFWQYLSGELLPAVERRYPQTEGGPRLAAGFSLGGYTVSLLATHLPGYFDHAACYDGLFMWTGHQDPRQKASGAAGPCTDPVWCRAGLLDAALGRPRDAAAMRRWNPSDRIASADAEALSTLQGTTFWVRCADGDGNIGNRDRARFFADLLRSRGLRLAPGSLVLAPGAAHTWHWADRFLLRFLDAALG